MPRLCLVATSLFASACVLQAAAQVPATSLTPGALPAQPFTTNQSLFTDTPASTFSMKVPQPGPYLPQPHSFNVEPPTVASTLDLHVDTKALRLQVKDKELDTNALIKRDRLGILAENNQPCYKLHVYGFTPQDLKSPHPRSSTETDCTPASSAHLKVLQLPATLNTK